MKEISSMIGVSIFVVDIRLFSIFIDVFPNGIVIVVVFYEKGIYFSYLPHLFSIQSGKHILAYFFSICDTLISSENIVKRPYFHLTLTPGFHIISQYFAGP